MLPLPLRPPFRTKCIADIVQTDEDAVFNVLVDMGTIERVILIPRADEARRALWNSGMKTGSIAMVYTANGDKLFAGSLQKFQGGRGNLRRRLHEDMSGALEREQENVQRCAEACRNEAAAKQRCEAEKQGVDRELRELKAKLSQHSRTATALEQQIHQLRSQATAEEPEMEGMLRTHAQSPARPSEPPRGVSPPVAAATTAVACWL